MIATAPNCFPLPPISAFDGESSLPQPSTTHEAGVPRLECINPAEIRKSPWHVPRYYRHTDNISDTVLLGSIRHFGRNLQPIKVRPCVSGPDDTSSIRFELVFGERRRRACLELGFPVLALIEDLNDQQAFAQAEASTFQAEGPSLLERGTRFEQVIDERTFLSAMDLTSGAGLPSDIVYKSLAIQTLLEVLDGTFEVNSGLHDSSIHDHFFAPAQPLRRTVSGTADRAGTQHCRPSMEHGTFRSQRNRSTDFGEPPQTPRSEGEVTSLFTRRRFEPPGRRSHWK